MVCDSGTIYRSAVLWMLVMASWCPAATVTTPTTQATAQMPTGKILLEFSADDALDVVVQKLQDADPGAKIVLVPGDTEMPRVRLSLKNVLVEDVVAVIAAAYREVNVTRISGSTGTIQVIRLASLDGGRGGGEGVGVRHQSSLRRSDKAMVRVYSLASPAELWAIGHAKDVKQGDTKALREQALDHILSLIQAVLRRAPGSKPPVVEVHAPTSTLIILGSPEQQAAVEEVLAALKPEADDMGRQVTELNVQNQNLNGLLDQQRQESQRLSQDLERLREQLKQVKPVDGARPNGGEGK